MKTRSALSLLVAVSCALPACTTDTTSQLGTSQGTLAVNSNATSGAGTAPAVETAGDPEGIVLLNGKLYSVKDQRATLLVGRQRFAQGLDLDRNGQMTLRDGRRVTLREGEMVTFAGEVREAPRGIILPRPLAAGQ